MFKKITAFFRKAWEWIEALWEKHDDQLEEMVQAVLPMVIDVAFRNDLKGEEKRKLIVDTVVAHSKVPAENIAISMINEAIEIAANKYNIQIGKLTTLDMDNARDILVDAAKDYAEKKLGLGGKEAGPSAEAANAAFSNEDLG